MSSIFVYKIKALLTLSNLCVDKPDYHNEGKTIDVLIHKFLRRKKTITRLGHDSSGQY